MMISDITLGQFFPGKSLLHRLDPRCKIVLAIIYIACVFTSNNPLTLAILFLFTASLVFIGGISYKVILKSIKPIIFILVFTSFLNIFLTKGDTDPLIQFYFINIYTVGIVRAVFMSSRVVMLIIGTSMLLTYTTSPIALSDGIESLLSPFKRIGLPVHAFAMMMSIALRFIPTLVKETEKIMNAQKSRGADFSSGGLIKRARALVPILVPLFVSAFKRADELATAMECRCYRGDINRTKFVKLEYKPIDIFSFCFMLILLASVILLTVLPYQFDYQEMFFKIIFYKV